MTCAEIMVVKTGKDELWPYIPVIYPASLLAKKDTSAAMSAGSVWRGMAKDFAH